MESPATADTRITGAIWLVLVAAALIFALSLGIRQAQVLFISVLTGATGLGLAAVSLAYAVAQLVWGASQPFAGALADRFGSGRILALGAVLTAVGMALVPFSGSLGQLVVSIGVLAAIGTSLAGTSVLMAAATRAAPPGRRGLATGFVNAGGSFGQFTLVPLAQWLIDGVGWVRALQLLALLCLVILPLAIPLRGSGHGHAAARAGEPERSLWQALCVAAVDANYRYLCVGFFICGFHIGFIGTHLPGVVATCQLPAQVAAWSLAVIGLFNIAGSVGMGWAVGRWRMKSLLSLTYASRGVAIVLFLLAPKTETTFMLFSAALGFTYLSTVPPTAGLIARGHGARYIGALFGTVVFVHQVGAFFGAWLGGKAFELSGTYDWMWGVDIALAVVAALIHLPIREAPVARLAAAT